MTKVPEIKRDYNQPDGITLLTCNVVCEAAIDNQAFIVSQREVWSGSFFTTLQTRIDDAIDNILSIYSKKDLRAATISVRKEQRPVLKLLEKFKTQLEVDYVAEPARLVNIKTEIGFITHWDRAFRLRSVSQLIEMLSKFNKYMTPALQDEIEGKGMTAGLITSILTYCELLVAAYKIQQKLKISTKEITAANVEEINAIYIIVIGICKVCHNLYVDDKIKQQLFAFDRIASNMRHLVEDTTPPEVPPTTDEVTGL